MSDVTEHYVVLDTAIPDRPMWKLAPAVDRIPAELDEIGRPLPTEEGRVVLWATTQLDRQLSLTSLPSPAVYRVNGVDGSGLL